MAWNSSQPATLATEFGSSPRGDEGSPARVVVARSVNKVRGLAASSHASPMLFIAHGEVTVLA
eukprot:6654905-Karenia_brevis.AAC.1